MQYNMCQARARVMTALSEKKEYNLPSMDKKRPPGIIYKVILYNDPGPQMEMPGRKGQRFKFPTKKHY